jgi:long-chain acyl-CoA synthetase
MLLRDIIANGARSHGGNVALIYHDRETTYSELAQTVDEVARGLLSLGLRKGDRIGLLLMNCTPFVYIYYAAQQIGVVPIPVNPSLKAPELEYIWRDADIRLVATAAGGNLLANTQAARAGLPTLKHILSIQPIEEFPDPGVAAAIPGFVTLPDLIERGRACAQGPDAPGPELLMPDIDENSVAVIMYTAGTTGRPKGAMLSHKNLSANLVQVQHPVAFSEQDRFLTVLPLFHSFAGTICMNLVLTLGACSVLMDNFTPNRAFEAIEKYRITKFPGVPALYHAMLQYPADREYDLSSLKLFVSGGAPLPAHILKAVEERFGVLVLEGDGPTETSPVTSVNPEKGPRKLGSIGPALPGVTYGIVNDDDVLLPPGQIGEIVVKGDNVMLGYLNQPEATAEAMRNGWYHTGDLGYLDEDAYCYIVDRKKDMIITAGMNVYPREVEDVLFAHPAVANAAVIGMPDALRGEDVLAVVVQRPGTTVTERELKAFCRERLANFKNPGRVLFRDSLPLGGTGKVIKRLLKKELELEGAIGHAAEAEGAGG